jgi:hypothetical protein
MLQAKLPFVFLALLALGTSGCGRRMSRSYRVVQVPVYVPTVVIYQNGHATNADAYRQAQERAAREQAAREAAEAEQRAQEEAAREQAAREQAAREQAAREAAEREAAEREQARLEQEQAAARARAAQAARGGTTIIIVGPGGAPPQGQARQAAPGVWISGE